MRGVVNSVTPAGRGLDRKGSMTLHFDRMTISGRTYSIRATVIGAIEAENDNAKVATGAGVGAIIGGILGGFKGALAGILIGGGGNGRGDRRQRCGSAARNRAARQIDEAIDVAQ